MKQGLKQLPRQSLTLTPYLQNQIKLLALPGEEVRKKLGELINEFCEEEEGKDFFLFKEILLTDKYQNFLNFKNRNLVQISEVPQKIDLKNTLLDQLYILNLKEHEVVIGEYLIDSIDEDGRLDVDIDYSDISALILESFNLTIAKREIEKVLLEIQNLEPVGCGYRNILESLIVQTEHLEIEEKDKENIKQILKKFSTDEADIKPLDIKQKNLVKQLRFNPGRGIGSTVENYIRPDLIALKNLKEWDVTLNDSFLIESLISKIKLSLDKTSSSVNKDVDSFIKGLEKRQQTLLLVAKFIISKQKGYLDETESLTPLTLKQIASSNKVSESTVSRIVKFKYLQLPTRNIPLSKLLEKKVTGRSEESKEVSPSQLIKLINKIVNSEEKSNPLSDQNIKKSLKENYEIDIARRTVSKYRQQANILPSKERF